MPRSRGKGVCLAALVACGPSSGSSEVGEGSEGTVADPSSSGDTGVSASESVGGDTLDPTTTPSTSSTGTLDDTAPLEPPDPGQSPETCELPTRDNASVTGTSDIGEVALSAVVFAESWDAECWPRYRLVFARSVADLEETITRVENGGAPLEGLVVDLAIPAAGVGPGQWQGPFSFSSNMMGWLGTAIAEITAATALDAAPPAIEGTLSGENGFGSMAGAFAASYCARVRGDPCPGR